MKYLANSQELPLELKPRKASASEDMGTVSNGERSVNYGEQSAANAGDTNSES